MQYHITQNPVNDTSKLGFDFLSSSLATGAFAEIHFIWEKVKHVETVISNQLDHMMHVEFS